MATSASSAFLSFAASPPSPAVLDFGGYRMARTASLCASRQNAILWWNASCGSLVPYTSAVAFPRMTRSSASTVASTPPSRIALTTIRSTSGSLGSSPSFRATSSREMRSYARLTRRNPVRMTFRRSLPTTLWSLSRRNASACVARAASNRSRSPRRTALTRSRYGARAVLATRAPVLWSVTAASRASGISPSKSRTATSHFASST